MSGLQKNIPADKPDQLREDKEQIIQGSASSMQEAPLRLLNTKQAHASARSRAPGERGGAGL